MELSSITQQNQYFIHRGIMLLEYEYIVKFSYNSKFDDFYRYCKLIK